MKWKPQKTITDDEVKKGMKLVIADGLATEAMTVFTSGTFLIAFALLLGASNFEIGLLAALPTLTNIFQLISIWLVRKYNNRRAISVLCSYLARSPLIIIGIIAFTDDSLTIRPVLLFLFFYYFFGSVAGPSWNAWMKDLIPENMLGTYFSRRTSYMQILNVGLSLLLALLIDYVKKNFPAWESNVYMLMFIAAGICGLLGSIALSRVPEPESHLERENIFNLLKRPLKDSNFRRLLIFNSVWLFAVNLATPFFIVFMMKSMNLSLPYIIGLTIISQLFSILTIRVWGRYADRYSNKTIIAICAPLYMLCLLAWCFVGIYSQPLKNLLLLAAIHILMGISTAGINLSLTNIGLKLAPSNQSIVYLSAKNIITALFSSLAPILGGYLADYFTHRSLAVNALWTSPGFNKVLHLISLHEWKFLFLIAAVIAFIAVELLVAVKETGEVDKDKVVRVMRRNIRSSLKEYFLIGHLVTWQEQLWNLIRRKI